VVEANVHDIGTGVQTVLSQIAADELGISPDQVEMRWGDTDLPRTGPTYGSSTTVGTGSAVAAAARDVSKHLAELGQGGRDPSRRSIAPGSMSSSARAPSSCPGRCWSADPARSGHATEASTPTRLFAAPAGAPRPG
jgi:CO/xanthine dehydrogenase Mo-binding subunit